MWKHVRTKWLDFYQNSFEMRLSQEVVSCDLITGMLDILDLPDIKGAILPWQSPLLRHSALCIDLGAPIGIPTSTLLP